MIKYNNLLNIYICTGVNSAVTCTYHKYLGNYSQIPSSNSPRTVSTALFVSFPAHPQLYVPAVSLLTLIWKKSRVG